MATLAELVQGYGAELRGLKDRQPELVETLLEDLIDNSVIEFDLVAHDEIVDFPYDEETDEDGAVEITGVILRYNALAVLDALAVLGLAIVPIELLGENVASDAYFEAVTGVTS